MGDTSSNSHIMCHISRGKCTKAPIRAGSGKLDFMAPAGCSLEVGTSCLLFLSGELGSHAASSFGVGLTFKLSSIGVGCILILSLIGMGLGPMPCWVGSLRTTLESSPVHLPSSLLLSAGGRPNVPSFQRSYPKTPRCATGSLAAVRGCSVAVCILFPQEHDPEPI